MPIDYMAISVIQLKEVYFNFKGSPTTKANTCIYKSLPVKTKIAFLSMKLILLAMLLHGQFIHYTQISLYPNIHFCDAQQCAYQSF